MAVHIKLVWMIKVKEELTCIYFGVKRHGISCLMNIELGGMYCMYSSAHWGKETFKIKKDEFGRDL
jgi:hypothetical protein